MTIAYVKNADGTGGEVQNTFRDSAGALHTLSDFFTDSLGVQHQVFFDLLWTGPSSAKGQVFDVVADPRVFNVVAEPREFTA